MPQDVVGRDEIVRLAACSFLVAESDRDHLRKRGAARAGVGVPCLALYGLGDEPSSVSRAQARFESFRNNIRKTTPNRITHRQTV